MSGGSEIQSSSDTRLEEIRDVLTDLLREVKGLRYLIEEVVVEGGSLGEEDEEDSE